MARPEGDAVEDGIAVRRFAHPPRNDLGRARVPLRHKLRFLARRALDRRGAARVASPGGDARLDGGDFLRRQGPWCEGLHAHLARAHDRYDAVIFFTALYAPTAVGIARWPGPAVLVPLLHDEKPMHLPVFHGVFRRADALLFNTAAEQRLARRLYGPLDGWQGVAGVGIDVQRPAEGSIDAARRAFGIDGRYVVYVGRIHASKGCGELRAVLPAWVRRDPAARLVLVGQPHMRIEPHPRLTCTGFVSAAVRDALIAGAAALVIPSRYESLSLVALEAMALGVPVVANAQCEVLADHVRHSGSGLLYHGRAGLADALHAAFTLDDAGRRRHAEAGRRYVAQHYAWPAVMATVEAAVHAACARHGARPPADAASPGR